MLMSGHEQKRSINRIDLRVKLSPSDLCFVSTPLKRKEITGSISITSNARRTGHHSAGGPLVSISYLWHKIVPGCSIACFQQNAGVELKRQLQ
jgi:hypothetical protein